MSFPITTTTTASSLPSSTEVDDTVRRSGMGTIPPNLSNHHNVINHQNFSNQHPTNLPPPPTFGTLSTPSASTSAPPAQQIPGIAPSLLLLLPSPHQNQYQHWHQYQEQQQQQQQPQYHQQAQPPTQPDPDPAQQPSPTAPYHAFHNDNSEDSQDNRHDPHNPQPFVYHTTTMIPAVLLQFVTQAMWPGLGLLGESYMLFSIGTLQPIWQLLYPECFHQQPSSSVSTQCHAAMFHRLAYAVVTGVIVGMVVVGYWASYMGRRRGSILTATFMCLGAVILTGVATWGSDQPLLVIRGMTLGLAIFGFGVGGEYPLAAASASEQAMTHHAASPTSTMTTIPSPAPPSFDEYRIHNYSHPEIHHHNLDHSHTATNYPGLAPVGDGLVIDTTAVAAAITTHQPHPSPTGESPVLSSFGLPRSVSSSLVPPTVAAVDEPTSAAPSAATNTSTANAAAPDGPSCPSFDHPLPALSQQQQQIKRGQQIQLVFSMQGVGIFLHTLLLSILLWLFQQGSIVIQSKSGGNEVQQQQEEELDNYTRIRLVWIWRLIYMVGTIILLLVLYTRIVYLKESKVWQEDRNRRQNSQQGPTNDNRSKSFNNTDEEVEDAQTGGFPPPPNTTTTMEPYPSLTAAPSPISVASTVSSLSLPSVAIQAITSHDEFVMMDTDVDMTMVTTTKDGGGGTYPILHHNIACMASHRHCNSPVWLLLLRNYGVRLFGTSLCWLLWDVAFYGNKLFQSSFLLALTGDQTTLIDFANAATLNAGCALLGYFGAAWLVDRIGRRRLQQWGFMGTGIMFVACGFFYQTVTPAFLVVMYLGSSFLGQLGPNATTYLIPAEIFPTEVRTSCHGIAAAAGKVGALIATIVFSHVDDEVNLFLLSGYASFAACAITFWTIPETLGLDLHELDCKWRLILEGRKGEYQGAANLPKFLSPYERHRLMIRAQRQQQLQHHDQADFRPYPPSIFD